MKYIKIVLKVLLFIFLLTIIMSFVIENKYETKYFDELLERIKTIRVSERMAYQKVTDLLQQQQITIQNQKTLIPSLK